MPEFLITFTHTTGTTFGFTVEEGIRAMGAFDLLNAGITTLTRDDIVAVEVEDLETGAVTTDTIDNYAGHLPGINETLADLAEEG